AGTWPRLQRLPTIARMTAECLVGLGGWHDPLRAVGSWGLLWWLFLVAALALPWTPARERRPRAWLAASVALPFLALTFAYIYSAWGPHQGGWPTHVRFSQFRLALQQAPAALLLIGVTLGGAIE